MGGEDRKRAASEDDAKDTSETVAGKRDRAPTAGAGNPDKSPGNQEKRCPADDFLAALVADKEVVMEYAQWWNTDLKTRLDATQASAVDGVSVAMSA